MKKKYLIIIISLVLISGCDKKKTLTCTKTEQETGMNLTTTTTTNFKNDKIASIKLELNAKLDSTYVKYKDTIKKSLEQQYSIYKDEKGVTYHTSVKDDNIKFNLIVDNKAISKETRKKLNISNGEGYEKSKKLLEKDGYTCK